MTGTAITVEVVYALPERQTLIALAVAPGTTAGEAVRLSGVLSAHAELAEGEPSIGIFGRIVGREHVLGDGDRIEIYRPLVADPKARRNERVARKRQGRKTVRNMRAGARTKKASDAGAPGRCLC